MRFIYQKLRHDLRGEIKTLSFGQAEYEIFPIELGQIQGLKTNFQIYTLPGDREHGLVRQQLSQESYGIIFIVDSDASRLKDNILLAQDLQKLFQLCGVNPLHFPGVIQYNKRDLPSGLSVEEMQSKINIFNWPFFEATAHHGLGVLQTLTTVSKSVIRYIKAGGKGLKIQMMSDSILDTDALPTPPPLVSPAQKAPAAIGSELSLLRVEPQSQHAAGTLHEGVFQTILTFKDGRSGKEFFSKIRIKPKLTGDGFTLKFLTEKE